MELERYRALLLDKAFRPIRVLSWQRAVVLDLTGRVDVLEYYAQRVRTASRTFPLPAVMRAPTWTERRPLPVAVTRRNVLIRDEFRCRYCGVLGSSRELTVDHVLPRSRGGRTAWLNVVAACGPCNRRKADRTPDEAGMRLLVAPSQPSALQFGRKEMVGMCDPPALWRAWLG